MLRQIAKIEDTQLKQHPFRVAAPIQPKQDMTNRTTPTPINKYMNLQRANLLANLTEFLRENFIYSYIS